MALRLELREQPARKVLDALRPARSKFMESNASRRFRANLQRYVAGDFAGRSLLISGHRGSGKTTMVARLVRELAESAVDQLRDTVEQNPDALRADAFMRPMLVKLHGPSLVADPAPEPKPKEEAKDKKTDETGKPEKEAEKPAPEPADENARVAQMALKQITIALYRALADEFAECFANEVNGARKTVAKSEEERLYEMSGQFRLDLDQGVEPAVLREYFASLDALRRGVLWPRYIGEAAAAGDVVDRGLREIQALATAAQAFRVCCGAIEYKQTVKDDLSRERAAETKLSLDVGDFANRLVGLTLGGVAGYGLGGATGAALGAGLLGAASAAWTSKRSARRQEAMDYTFIRDFSLQTLERDLPLVIGRVRAAGLAPIFVVDELDKVKDAAPRIGRLIDQLKHLTTDYGFFCFLTGQDYFEEVESRIASLAYPPEHTYFSERLFIAYTPDDFANFLSGVIEITPPASADDARAKAQLVRLLMHKAKMNVIDLTRELASAFASPSPGASGGFGDELAISVQLAIEGVFNTKVAAAFFRAYPSMRPYAIEVAYRFSREWEDGEEAFDHSSDACARYMLTRLGRDVPAEKPAEQLPERLRDRFEDLIRLFSIEEPLKNWKYLARLAGNMLDATEPGRGANPDRAALLEAVPGFGEGLLRPAVGISSWSILYDVLGRERRTDTLLASGAGPDGSQEFLTRAAADIEGFDAALKIVGVTLADLTACAAMPRSLDWPSLENAALDYRVALRQGAAPPNLAISRPIVENFQASASIDLLQFLQLTARLQRDLKQPPAPEEIWARIRKYVDPAGFASGIRPDWARVGEAGLGNPSPSTWSEFLRGKRFGFKPSAPIEYDKIDFDTVWERCRRRVLKLFGAQDPTLDTLLRPISYEDLLVAAQNDPPMAWMRGDLTAMTASDWSHIAMESLQRLVTGTPGIPVWFALAALKALRFDPGLVLKVGAELAKASSGPDGPEGVDTALISAPMPKPASGPGVLVIVADVEALAPSEVADLPYILVAREGLPRYYDAVRLLRANGLIEELYDEL